MLDPISKFVMEHVVGNLAPLLVPIMIGMFIIGAMTRVLIYYIARLESRFSKEFERRVRFYFTTPEAQAHKVSSFYKLTRALLEKTYFDCFETKEKYKRRNLDYITGPVDRLFLFQDGVKRLIEDGLRQFRYLRKDGPQPNMLEIAKTGFENNPYFNKLFGMVSVNVLHEFINILPGLFLIGGIFGTFLGISKGLPELGGMDLSNLNETKKVMDFFLVQISQAMVKSIIGIAFSAAMTMINTLFSLEALYYNAVNRYAGALDQLWNESGANSSDDVGESQPKSA